MKERAYITKLLAAAFWLTLIAAFWIYTQLVNLSPLAAIQAIADYAQSSPLGPLIYVLFYIIQPLVFFPSSLLSIAAGYLFGPVWGVVLAVIGSNGSSVLAFYVGRFFGRQFFDSSAAESFMVRYAPRLQQNGFESVLFMRLIFLPYDLLSYACGFLRIQIIGFMVATFLGGLPGSITFALFGASIEGEFLGQAPSLNPWTLAIAAVMFALSLTLSRYLRQREANDVTSAVDPTPPALSIDKIP